MKHFNAKQIAEFDDYNVMNELETLDFIPELAEKNKLDEYINNWLDENDKAIKQLEKWKLYIETDWIEYRKQFKEKILSMEIKA